MDLFLNDWVKANICHRVANNLKDFICMSWLDKILNVYCVYIVFRVQIILRTIPTER